MGGGTVNGIFCCIHMKRIQLKNTYEDIICLENLLDAWKEFTVGKRLRKDVQVFELNLMANIISLHRDLVTRQYIHSPYAAFNISDPKPRNIHKAAVRDRLLHHAIYRVLYSFFNSKFIPDSYSCRIGKGTHKAMDRFQKYGYKVSKNHARTVWVLKCDIRKFFASIDHSILLAILDRSIPDKDIIWLLSRVIGSFRSTGEGVGLPLGNLTSQLLVNIYMNEFDQFAKHSLKAKWYVRYADDFVILSENRDWLQEILERIGQFLRDRLKLELHPTKVSIETFASGVDFLGWVHFPDHRVMRTATKWRMMRRAQEQPNDESIQSYIGLLSHGNAVKATNEFLAVSGVQGE